MFQQRRSLVKPIFLFTVLSVTSLMASDVTRPTIWFSGPSAGGREFGDSFGPTYLLSCPVGMLADGLTITSNQAGAIGPTPAVTGLTLICRRFTPIGGTDTTVAPFTMSAGSPGPDDFSKTVECPSGQAMTGILGLSGVWLDALTIRCATLTPDYSQAPIHYSNDPFLGTGSGSPMSAGPSAAIGTAVGGSGGFPFDYNCPANAPFVNSLQGDGASYPDAAIGSITDFCSPVLTGLINARDTKGDFTVRTVGQSRSASRRVADGFTVEAFNLAGC
ncbi:MAG TPA: hypothetical protein VMJ13_06420 [Candidatus Acidoferrum sp.]|nr:hypothetical protein [Candidatus Acidoferrum sp.]